MSTRNYFYCHGEALEPCVKWPLLEILRQAQDDRFLFFTSKLTDYNYHGEVLIVMVSLPTEAPQREGWPAEPSL